MTHPHPSSAINSQKIGPNETRIAFWEIRPSFFVHGTSMTKHNFLLSAERIYRAMIMPIFTYCGQITLGWSETRRCQIRNLEQRSHRIILQNSKCLNCELRLSSIENFLKKKACLFVFDCLKGNVCSPFKDYFNLLIHDFNTRNSGTTIALPKVKLDFARKSFYFLGASAFNSLPLKIKQISCRILFRESLDQFFV